MAASHHGWPAKPEELLGGYTVGSGLSNVILASLDHLVRQAEDGSRDREAEGPGCSHIDDQFELGRLLHRQVGRLGALRDLVHVDSAPPDSFMASPAPPGIRRAIEKESHVTGERPRALHGGSGDAGDQVRLRTIR